MFFLGCVIGAMSTVVLPTYIPQGTVMPFVQLPQK